MGSLKEGAGGCGERQGSARAAKGNRAASGTESVRPLVRLAWPLLGDLAGSPGLALQTNLHFLPEQDFLVARNLAPFTKGRKRVPREQCPTSRLLREAAGMLALSGKR